MEEGANKVQDEIKCGYKERSKKGDRGISKPRDTVL
jgi:hypothetical protein